jgi:hypothetical protein
MLCCSLNLGPAYSVTTIGPLVHVQRKEDGLNLQRIMQGKWVGYDLAPPQLSHAPHHLYYWDAGTQPSETSVLAITEMGY